MAEPSMQPGTMVDRFQLQERRGDGPLGPVYRAFDTALSRSVAIKLLDGLTRAGTRERFRAAAPGLVGLRHSAILAITAFGEHEQVPYLVWEYVPGGSLADRLATYGPGELSPLPLLDAIAAAVDHAHAAGVLHGDLKPANVLLDGSNRPLVSNFGIVPLLRPIPESPGAEPATDGAAGGQVPEVTRVAVASPEYAAPEQVAQGQVTAATDVYSFAAIAHLLLTGAPPAPGTAPGAGASQPVAAVLRRGLAADPSARWASCVEMSLALRDAMTPPPAAEPARGGRRGLYMLGGAAAALLVLAAVALIWRAGHPPSQPQTTVGITLSSVSVQQGGSLTVSGSHLPASQVGTVEMQSASRQIGAFQADANGNVNTQVTIPVDTAPGDHVVSLCWAASCHASARLAVVQAPPSPTPPPPPTAAPTPTPQPATPRPTLPPLSPRPTASAAAQSASPGPSPS
jgi:serine/threonine protein kinase